MSTDTIELSAHETHQLTEWFSDVGDLVLRKVIAAVGAAQLQAVLERPGSEVSVTMLIKEHIVRIGVVCPPEYPRLTILGIFQLDAQPSDAPAGRPS